MLEVLEPGPEFDLQRLIAGMHVEVRNVPSAIAVRRYWEDEAGTEPVAHLQPRVIVAVPKGGRLDESRVGVPCAAELLREDAERHIRVLPFRPRIRDDEPAPVDGVEKMMERPADVLDRVRVHGFAVHRAADRLNPHPAKDPALMALQQREQLAEQPNVMPLQPRVGTPKRRPQVGTFNFYHEAAEPRRRRRELVRKKTVLQVDEFEREILEAFGGEGQRQDAEERLHRRGRTRQHAGLAGLIEIAEEQGWPKKTPSGLLRGRPGCAAWYLRTSNQRRTSV